MSKSVIKSNEKPLHGGALWHVGLEKDDGNTKYRPLETPTQIKALAKLGLTMREIAEELNVTPNTLSSWAKRYIAVDKALREGMESGENWRVKRAEDALYMRAFGFTYTETEFKEVLDKDGNLHTLKRVAHKTHVPDVKAAEIVLTNRQPDKWRKDTNELAVNVNVDLTDRLADARSRARKIIKDITKDAQAVQPEVSKVDALPGFEAFS